MEPPITKHTGPSFQLKLMTYNIHSCVTIDRKCEPESTLAAISQLSPDVVALQEVDVGKHRTRFLNQAEYLASGLGMEYHFFPVVEIDLEQYGLAVLSRYPARELQCVFLPALKSKKPKEMRGAMSVTVNTPGGRVLVVNTHFALYRKDRKVQAEALFLDPVMAGALEKGDAVVLCGDFNCGPRSPVYRKITAHLTDVQTFDGRKTRPKSTFISWYPFLRLDHIFVSNHFRPVHVDIPSGNEVRRASDHLPVFAELAMNVQRARNA